MHDEAKEIREFERLKPNLQRIWADLQADPSYKHTSVIVPSLSVDQEELAKVTGASYYEERLMFALIRLRSRNARVIYLTSQPVHPDVVDYYLQMLEGVPVNHARQRLLMMSVHDASSRPLTEKILERPRLISRLRNSLGDAARAYLTCYNSTVLERRLAVQLGIPLNGVDPSLLHFGTKSGSREIFRAANVNLPLGFENLHSEDDIVAALLDLAKQRPGLKRAVVKLDEGFSGEGNGLFTYPAELSDASVRAAMQDLRWSSGTENFRSFLRKYKAMGGIVEEMVEAEEVRSPSVQMRIHPDGHSTLVSSHEQVLGGSTGQVYLGCRFPADQEYRGDLQEQAERIGTALSERGVIGRFGIDFLVSRKKGGDWQSHAIEINLRMGGTTPPYHALEFLTGGRLNTDTGLFHTIGKDNKYYSATDNLKSPAYHGLLPEDLFEIITRHGLGYRHATGTGVLFYMIGALSQYGKVGMTAIGNSPEQAQELFDRTVAVLDAECEGGHGVQSPIFDRHVTME